MKIDKNNIENILALTPIQEGMLFHYLSDPASMQYFEQIAFKIIGDVDTTLFKEAWQHVVNTNEMLRTMIRWEKLEKAVQITLKRYKIPINVYDFIEDNDQLPEVTLETFKENDRIKGIDLKSEPFRIALCKTGESIYEMILTSHHLIFDGWSTGIMLKEFHKNYNNLVQRKPLSIESKPLFREFVKWYQHQDMHEKLVYWKKNLHSFKTKSVILPDVNTKQRDKHIKKYTYKIPSEIKTLINEYLKKHEITLADLLYSAWGILLHRYNNTHDVMFGTTVSGRDVDILGIGNMVGLFINTLPLRMTLQDEERIIDYIQHVSHALNERRDFEQTPLQEIKECCEIDKKESLFDSIVVIENYVIDKNINNDGESINIRSSSQYEVTNFNITLQVMAFDDIELHINYKAQLYYHNTIERMMKHLYNIIITMISYPDMRVIDIDILSTTEEEQITHTFNNSYYDYDHDATIDLLIEACAMKFKTKTAVTYQHHALTYEELNNKSNQVAWLLREKGVTSGTVIGLMMPRSLEMIIGLLGIMKSGGVCLPIDVEHPKSRIDTILDDSHAEWILCKQGSSYYDNESNHSIVNIDFNSLNKYSTESIERVHNAQGMAYIIYTSGSTGKPKGAILHHRGVINHAWTKINVLDMNETDIVGNSFSINVVASIWQILAPLFIGAQLIVYDDDVEMDPYKQFLKLHQDNVTIIEVIPSILNAYMNLLERDSKKIELPRLRKIALTSEEVRPFLVNKFYEVYDITLVDCYGQTECCDDTLHYNIPFNKKTTKVPIGQPAHNTKVYVMDRHYKLQPIGVPGELCISGDGVSYGYWNRPELTAEKFIPNPLDPEKMMYRTGDLARWMSDGNVEYMGRLDHQVKIRGNRIEIGEIESRLLKYPSIDEVAVIAREDEEENKYLCAYLTSEENLTISQLREYLMENLPDYMIPSFFVQLEAMPHTPNGKIDKKILPKSFGNMDTGIEYTLPSNEVEEQILAIWESVLKSTKIGTNDSFFDLGGNSMLIIQVHAKIDKQFPSTITIPDLFIYTTIAKLAQYICSVNNSANMVSKIKPMKLPLDYFNESEGMHQALSIKYDLEGEMRKKIGLLAVQNGLDEVSIIIALYAYILSQVSKEKNIQIQLLNNSKSVQLLDVSLSQMNDWYKFFTYMDQLYIRATKSTKLIIGEITSQLIKERYSITPFFYDKKLQSFEAGLSDNFDLILQYKSTDDCIQLVFDYNSKVINGNKMQDFVNNYIKLLQYVTKNIELRGNV